MLKVSLFILATFNYALLSTSVNATEDDCNLKGYDQTKPAALLNPNPNTAPLDWGSDVDEVDDIGHGLQFWHYIRNREGPNSSKLWITWEAAKLYTSITAPLEPGRTICNQFRVFTQPGQKFDDKTPGYAIDNSANIVYGSKPTSQIAPVYIEAPVPGIADLIKSWVSTTVFHYTSVEGTTTKVTTFVETSRDGSQYRIDLHAMPAIFRLAIGQLPDMVAEKHLTSILSQFNNEDSKASVGRLIPLTQGGL